MNCRYCYQTDPNEHKCEIKTDCKVHVNGFVLYIIIYIYIYIYYADLQVIILTAGLHPNPFQVIIS